MKDDELYAAVWAIAAPLLRQDRDEVRARLRARIEGADVPGSEDLQELLRATDEGRVATVLLSRDETVWGRYDETSRTVHIADQAAPDNENLLNLLAVKTMAHGAASFHSPTTFPTGRDRRPASSDTERAGRTAPIAASGRSSQDGNGLDFHLQHRPRKTGDAEDRPGREGLGDVALLDGPEGDDLLVDVHVVGGEVDQA
jgi:hypothetical protein